MQALMRQFSIRTRMMGAIGVVLVLLTMIGGAGLWGMNRLHALSVEFVDHAFEETLTLSRLQVALGDMGRFEKDMIIGYEKPEEVAKAKTQWQGARDAALQQMDHMLVGDEDGDNAVVREMKDQLTAYANAVEPVTRQLADNGYDTATVANRMLARAHEQYAGILVNLKRVEEVLKVEAATLQQEEKDINAQTLLVFGVAVALAISEYSGLGLEPTTLAKVAQSAENDFVGCACGIMDQMASAASVADHALLLDCRSLQHMPIPIHASLAITVIDTGLRRNLTESAFNERRAQCEAAAAHFGLKALRDLDLATLEAGQTSLDPTLYRRARHVVGEIERVEPVAVALTQGDTALLAEVMREAHLSLSQDFDVSLPPIDRLAQMVAEALGDAAHGVAFCQ